MTPSQLRSARDAKGWNQVEAARRLRVSQSYLAMLERGQRRLTADLARRVARVYDLPPTSVPPAPQARRWTPAMLASDLAALGYPGFTHLRSRAAKAKNPGEVLVAALAQEDLEARVVEALPWLAHRYWALDWGPVVRETKSRDLQNRLGFVVALARGLADRAHDERAVEALADLERTLERSRLAREDTLCRGSMPAAERRWLADHRSEEAKHWSLLTDWTVDALRYADGAPPASSPRSA